MATTDDPMPVVDRVVAATSVVTPEGVLAPGWVGVRDGLVVAAGAGDAPTGADRRAGVLVPGFVDIHTHGAAGVDYGDAEHGATGAGDIAPAVDRLVRHGTTSIVASLATADPASLRRRVAALGDRIDGEVLRGIHLEGPWLSAGHRGTHSAELLRHPDPREVRDVLEITDAIRMVTLAPELPGALDAVRAIVDAGAVAAVGHTSGTAADARAAFDAGATVATHLFNGMPSFHHREPGPVGAALLDERVRLELILDGMHLDAGAVALVARLAGDRIVAVSDAMAATGRADGVYELAGTAVRVTGGIARTLDTGSLAGSTGLLHQAFAALVHDHGFDLPAAVAATSTTAADAVGLHDVGRIAPGSRADLVLLDDDLAVAAVMRRGRWVHD